MIYECMIVKGMLQFVTYLYNHKGKGKAMINYDRNMFTVQATVTTIVNYSCNKFIVQAAGVNIVPAFYLLCINWGKRPFLKKKIDDFHFVTKY